MIRRPNRNCTAAESWRQWRIYDFHQEQKVTIETEIHSGNFNCGTKEKHRRNWLENHTTAAESPRKSSKFLPFVTSGQVGPTWIARTSVLCVFVSTRDEDETNSFQNWSLRGARHNLNGRSQPDSGRDKPDLPLLCCTWGSFRSAMINTECASWSAITRRQLNSGYVWNLEEKASVQFWVCFAYLDTRKTRPEMVQWLGF